MSTLPPEVESLAPFAAAGVLGPAEIHLARTIERLIPGLSADVLLAIAVAARAPRLGHVCIELDRVADRVIAATEDSVTDLSWPDPPRWIAAVLGSDAVSSPDEAHTEPRRPLVWDGQRLYLHRYWQDELTVAEFVRASTHGAAGDGRHAVDPTRVNEVLDTLFGAPLDDVIDRQRAAAAIGLTSRFSVIAGGPGTGKTRTVALLLAAQHQLAEDEGRTMQVALAAPTGKAAARMTEAVHRAVDSARRDRLISSHLAEHLEQTQASTVHRLLGASGGGRMRHDARNPLPHDAIIIDETSMVSLPLMAQLVQAIRPGSQLVLVGDPFQLSSVEAGTVLSDIVGPIIGDGGRGRGGGGAPDTSSQGASAALGERVTVLTQAHRFSAESGIAAFADAIRVGDADTAMALLASGRTDLQWIDPADDTAVAALEALLIDAASDVVRAARHGDARSGLDAATRVKLLAATRHQAFGVHDWSRRIEAGVSERLGDLPTNRHWFVGRPVIITANDRLTRVANGDVGLVVEEGGSASVTLDDGGELRSVPTSRLAHVESWWAMTIHKSQGSEFPHAVVSLPTVDSPVLTRELLYTAATRAKDQLTLIASEDQIRRAIARPIARASGLRSRLWPET